MLASIGSIYMPRKPQIPNIKYTEEAKQFIKDNFKVDPATGHISATTYAQAYLNICYKGRTFSVTIAHLVFFLTYGRWPTKGLHVDHIDDDPLNNKPDNLREITLQENQAKRRGKGNKQYGTGKYGEGIHVQADKRDGRFYVTRYLSSKEEINKKNRKKSLGGFPDLEKAEAFVREYIAGLRTIEGNLK